MSMKTEKYIQTILGILNDAEVKLTIKEYHDVVRRVSFLSGVKASALEETFKDCVQKVIVVKKPNKKGVKK